MAKQTQVLALFNQIKTGKITSDKARILDYITKNPYTTDLDLVNNLGMHHKTASARLTDLEDLGLLTTRGTAIQDGNERGTYVATDNISLASILADARTDEKYEKWLKKGLKAFDTKMSLPLIELLQQHFTELYPENLK